MIYNECHRSMSRRWLGKGGMWRTMSRTMGLAAGESKAIMAFMPETSAAFSAESMRREKRAVAGNSVLAALVITSLKIVVGIATGSLGILSEAAHSGLDLIAALVTFFSVRVSDKPADADHQYGHGKFENFSAFIETGLLLLTCVWIVYEAIRRLFFHSVEIEPSVAAFLVMSLSMAVDAWRSRALGRIAKKYDSQALEADALHFSTDIWSSGGSDRGPRAGLVRAQLSAWRWLRQADPIAALFVAGVVVSVSWRLARRTADALLDAAPVGVRSQILDRISDRRWRAGSGAGPLPQSREPLFRGRFGRAGTQFHLPALRAGVRCGDGRACARFCPMPT